MNPFQRTFSLPSLLAFAAFLVASVAAHADPSMKVGPIQINNLASCAGKSIHLFFVRASDALMGLPGQQLEFTEIRATPQRQPIPANGQVTFDAVAVPKKFEHGIPVTFTHLFFAITDANTDTLYLRNLDRVDGAPAPIIDPRMSVADLNALPDTAFHALATGFMSKTTVVSRTRGDGTVVLDDILGITRLSAGCVERKR